MKSAHKITLLAAVFHIGGMLIYTSCSSVQTMACIDESKISIGLALWSTTQFAAATARPILIRVMPSDRVSLSGLKEIVNQKKQNLKLISPEPVPDLTRT